MKIRRERALERVRELLRWNPVVGILGARQVGKTTLARELARQARTRSTYFDLEDVRGAKRLADPTLALEKLRGLAVIDEVQRLPDLFMVLRVLADRERIPCRFLVLGSASPELLRQSSESLAGRIAYYELGGFTLEEVGVARAERLWSRGGLPRSYLPRNDLVSFDWRRDFIQTFLERDLPQLGIPIAAATMRRFWTMLAHYHAQVWNASEFAQSFGVSHVTVRRYLDLLTSALVVRQLLPWHENISKRQVKAPKVYIRDSGLLHALLNLPNLDEIEAHPKVGASWEGFVIEQLIRRLGAHPEECYFWATYSGAELDLLVVRGRKRLGFEVKRTSAPALTPSMRNALADLSLNQLDVIYPGKDTFPLAQKVRAVGIARFLHDVKPL